MPEKKEKLVKFIKELCENGNQGNLHDFKTWIQSEYDLQCNDNQVNKAISELLKSGIIKHHSEIHSEYLNNEPPEFSNIVEYSTSSDLAHSPIQFVRSRLESFLKYHNASHADIIDISIATTEAMENAVKYSNEKRIKIQYSLQNNQFQIKIENEIKDVTPEQDILSGKYTGSLTLMRGMMVMVKLLNEVDIDIDEDRNVAIFTGKHKLKNPT